MSKVTLLQPQPSEQILPLVTSKVPAGFPSPCNEYLGDTLDLNQYVIKDPVSTFFARVEGDSMIGKGIKQDDIVAVDKALEAKHGDVVIAVIDGEHTIKQLHSIDALKLVAANENYADIPITGEIQFSIWGVVTFCISKIR